MGIYNEVQVEATVTKQVDSYFRCSRCGTEADAIAVGTGLGEGISPYGLDQDSAGQRARNTAEENALWEARTALAIAPCPRCGERDHSAVTKYKRKTVIGVVRGMGLFFVGGGLLSALMAFSRVPAIVGGVLGLLAGVVVYVSRAQKFGDAANQVKFTVRSPYRQRGFERPEDPGA